MSTRDQITEDTTGSVPETYNIEGEAPLSFDVPIENEQPPGFADTSFMIESTDSIMVTSEDAEKSITSATKGVTQYLSDHKYESGEISTSARELSSGKGVEEYTIRVPVAVTDAEEWVDIESDLQSIALDSETGNTNLYLVVDRFRS